MIPYRTPLWRYWIGRYRLRLGWCPECKSYPPRLDCWVCRGKHPQGLNGTALQQWRQWWDAQRNPVS